MPCCVCRLETRGCSLQYALACDTVDKDLMFPEYLHVCTICVNVDPVPSPSLRYHCSPLVFAHCRALPENLCMDSWLAGDIRTSRACICRVLNMWATDYRQKLSYSTCIRVELIWNWIVTHSLIKTPGSEAGTLEAKPQSMLPSFTIWYKHESWGKGPLKAKENLLCKDLWQRRTISHKGIHVLFLIWIIDHSSRVMHSGLY